MSNMTIYWHQFVVVSRIEEDVAYEWSMGEVDQLFFMQWLTLFRLGGGTMCPPCHVFAYTRVGMRIRMLIFCDFSSFLEWRRGHFPLNKIAPFSQEK